MIILVSPPALSSNPRSPSFVRRLHVHHICIHLHVHHICIRGSLPVLRIDPKLSQPWLGLVLLLVLLLSGGSPLLPPKRETDFGLVIFLKDVDDSTLLNFIMVLADIYAVKV